MDPDCQKLMSILMEQMHIHPRNISGVEELSCNSVTVSLGLEQGFPGGASESRNPPVKIGD